jgi:mono/diheme cytochrome c family protein
LEKTCSIIDQSSVNYPAVHSVNGFRWLLVLMLAALAACGDNQQDSAARVGTGVAESGKDALVALGRSLYRDGLRANGEPFTAVVAGDVEMLGTQYTCDGCHGISGMGSKEANIITPIIAGPVLFDTAVQPPRPAYDVNSLATVLRSGVTPSGRTLGRLMPRFKLSDDEVAALAAYLATLSIGSAPGVDASTIRFATVVTDSGSTQERDALLAVLNRFAEEKVRQTRLESRRWDRGTTPESQLPTVYREWKLDVWTLTGLVETWGEQLQHYYEKAPVFAILGGLLPESSAPLGQFCERNAIPCLLPSTNYPVARDGDMYSLYFSRGMGLEADLMAADIKTRQLNIVVQVYCEPSAERAAKQLDESLANGNVVSRHLAFDCDNSLPKDALRTSLEQSQTSAIVLWLNRDQLASMDELPDQPLYLSSTLIGNMNEPLPEVVSKSALVAHPYRVPGSVDSAYRRLEIWAKPRQIEISYPRIQGEAFFSAMFMSDMVKHMDRFFVREYLLDLIGHAQGMALYVPGYDHVTLGRDQIFLSKGGYLLPIVKGKIDTASAQWAIP